MRIGVLKEIKDKENRVGMIPEGVERLVQAGHCVLVEHGAGLGSGFSDQQYRQAGAEMVSATEAWASELVVKVKEPMPAEYRYLSNQMVFTFFHLSGVDESLTRELLARQTAAIAYETLEDEQGGLPILAPMSAVAGNMATLMGSYYLASFNKGRGVQLASVLGHGSGQVLVIGDGVVGRHAAKVAAAMGATVYVAGLNEQKFKAMRQEMVGELRFLQSTPDNIREYAREVDVVIGAVLVRGAKAPKVLTEDMVKTMQPGAVVVDVSIDQGGCVETSRPTTHSDPVFVVHDVVHYCVTNMPGAYPRTSTIALARATIEYVEKIAGKAFHELLADKHFARAINTYRGNITHEKVARDLGMQDRYKALF
ncbi:alanine dehydrogenase [Methylomarinum vadi]|uniref:alanine dehydrogenase n=1 Tax=Methylomarinum vadi TaxID=438855 RepID=UPI0004DF3562|nr:alanine dehydrogenase [Methylomarinum vadi]